MEKARRFCRDNRNAIIFCSTSNTTPEDIIVTIKGVCFSARFCYEAPSLIELLEKGNWLSPISKGFSHFGITLNECVKQNSQATIRVMRRRCQQELKKLRISQEDLYWWKILLQNLDSNAPAELRVLLEKTIKELEKFSSESLSKKEKNSCCPVLSQSQNKNQLTLFKKSS